MEKALLTALIIGKNERQDDPEAVLLKLTCFSQLEQGDWLMALDRSFEQRNRAATQRMRELVEWLSDEELQHPVGEHWTVAVALAHLAFWDGRVLAALDASERAGKVAAPTIDIVVNDISLPLWSAIPPREAARIAIATAETLDQRLESFPPDLLEQIAAFNARYVNRDIHRSTHLDEIDQALKT